jgi:Domain of unknown function (DUF1707)
MSEDSGLLIGDSERAAASTELRRHYEAGRVTIEELEARLDLANHARTEDDLRQALRQLPTAALPTFRPRDTRWRSLAVQYGTVNGIALLVWLFTGAQSDFWPKWVFLATLIFFVRRAVGPSRSHHRRALPAPPAPSDPPPGP